MGIAFIFSGQGSQYVGMGKELYDNYSCAREVFDKADKALGFSIKDICFEQKEALNLTENAQPGILTMSIAAFEVLKEKGIQADVTAGLSLGEYSAYVASGVLDFEETVALVKKRGKFMTEAVPLGEGGMYAIIGLENKLVEEACQEASEIGYVRPANYNAPGQIVIAGEMAAVGKAAQIAKEKGAKMVVKLNVSGPFHTGLLQPAADRLAEELKRISVKNMKIPVYTNLTASRVLDKDDIKYILKEQVISPVRWEEIIMKMYHDDEIDTFIEIGPGKALSGFVKRILKGVTVLNIEDLASLEKVANTICGKEELC